MNIITLIYICVLDIKDLFVKDPDQAKKDGGGDDDERGEEAGDGEVKCSFPS